MNRVQQVRRQSRLSLFFGSSVGLLWVVLLTASFAFSQVTGDSRTVTEPVFPPVCATLPATQPAGSSMDETVVATDTNNIQNAINGCYTTVQACQTSSACPAVQAVELQANGANNAFIIKPITLKAGVVLLIDAEVTLFASLNPGDYPNTGSTLISGGNANSSGIMGYGVIDGRGGWAFAPNATKVPSCLGSPCASWWAYGVATGGERPRLVGPSGSGLTLYKVTLQNAPMYHYTGSGSNQTIWGVKITAPGSAICSWQTTNLPCNAPNTDGLDPTGTTTNLTVTNSWVSDGDDDVAVKAGGGFMQNLTFSHNHFFQGHGMSVGSQTNTGLNNMLVTDLISDGTNGGGQYTLKIKSDAGSGGLVQNVLYDSVCILNGGHNLAFDPYYSSTYGTTNIPQMQNITLHDVHALTGGSNYLRGYRYASPGMLAGSSYPLSLTLDNVVFAGDQNSSQASRDFFGMYNGTAFVDNANFTLGPGPVNFDYELSSLATSNASITVTQTPGYPNGAAPYDCTGRYVDLAAELFSPVGATVTGTTVSLTAVLQPIVYGSPVPTGNITLYEVDQDGFKKQIGSPQLAGGALTSYPGSNPRSFTYLTIPNVTAGQHTYTAQYSGDTNYSTNPVWRSGYPGMTSLPTFPAVTITASGPAPVTATVVAANKIYDGSNRAVITSCSLSGVLPGDIGNVSCTVAGATFVSAGAGSSVVVTATGISLSGLAAGNYALAATSTATTATIYPAAPFLTVTCNETAYDGTPHTCTGSTLGVGGAPVAGSFVFNPPSATAAGSYPIAGTFTSTDPNYLSGEMATVILQIDPVTPSVAITCPAVIYDGAAHSCSGTTTGIGGATVAGSFSFNPSSATTVGSYPVSAIFLSSDPNYVNASGSGTLVIRASASGSVSASFSASALTFANPIMIGQSSPAQYVTVMSAGTAPLIVSGVTIGGANPGDFLVSNQAGTCTTGASLVYHANCNLRVVFVPTTVGARSAILSFNDNLTGAPQQISISGAAIPGMQVSLNATSLTFAPTSVGALAPAQYITIKSTGYQAAVISKVTLNSADFDLSDQAGTCTTAASTTLVPGANCNIRVKFHPSATGPLSVTVTINDNTTATPHVVSLSGMGK
jgi:polygalacturonase